ncbi:sucrose synthase, partial [bacterium]|nr:sucrose synthase [bacterium]
MLKSLNDLIDLQEVQDFRMFLYELWHDEKKYLLNNDIMLALEDFCKENNKAELLNGSTIYKLLQHTPELIISEDVAVLIHRYQMARYRFYKISIQVDDVEEISIRQLLDFRDRYVQPQFDGTNGKLHVDFLPFYDYGPNIKDVKSVGKGIEYLNKYMSSNLFQNPEKWNACLFEFLKIHSFGDKQLLIDGDVVPNYEKLIQDLEAVSNELDVFDPESKYDDVAHTLRKYGFEAGWGDTVARIQETMQLLLELFQSPDSQNLEKFISRIPMISNVAVISPHGWFGQENVLGRPDTGGQIVYILDQVRFLEQTLRERIRSYGLSTMPKILIVTRLIPDNQGTTCNMSREKIHHTENAYILRVPFTDEHGNVVQHWISRFKIWPYLERFAYDTKKELMSEFNGKPDLVIGNYSDGNMVATMLADQFDVIQCNIAHALEKNKYLFSDLNWRDFEKDYHFSLQHVVDLIAMNMADFVITSTFQEIAGSRDSVGQYESYQSFTMPGLMQVENGVNLFHPKFNVIPPGVDDNVYFPYTDKKRRLTNQIAHLEGLLFTEQNDSTVGHLDDPHKPPIFTMARLDHNKNITGLVESFGKSRELQDKCNLI